MKCTYNLTDMKQLPLTSFLDPKVLRYATVSGVFTRGVGHGVRRSPLTSVKCLVHVKCCVFKWLGKQIRIYYTKDFVKKYRIFNYEHFQLSNYIILSVILVSNVTIEIKIMIFSKIKLISNIINYLIFNLIFNVIINTFFY